MIRTMMILALGLSLGACIFDNVLYSEGQRQCAHWDRLPSSLPPVGVVVTMSNGGTCTYKGGDLRNPSSWFYR
jgi:hypothetical protein